MNMNMSGADEEDNEAVQVHLWRRGDVCDVDIPEADRPPPQESPCFGRRNRPASNLVAILEGKSPEQVEAEAARICLGERFNDFEQFDRCLDSWAVMNGRVVSRYKSKGSFRTRVCRFSNPVRKFSRIPPPLPGECNGGSEAEAEAEDAVAAAAVADDDDDDEGQDDCQGEEELEDESEDELFWHYDSRYGDYSGFRDRCSGKSKSKGAAQSLDPHAQPLLTAEQVEDIEFQKAILHMTGSQKQVRAPLGDLHPNNLLSKEPRVTTTLPPALGVLTSRPRAIIKHTSVWLPGTKSGNKSATGACGEMSRFRPPESYDEEGVDTSLSCPFRVRCHRQAETGAHIITVCDLKHTCAASKHKWRGPTQKSVWLGDTLAPRVTRNLKVPVKELLNGFQGDYKKSTTYHQMWRAKDYVRHLHLGGQEDTFRMIPALIARVREADPACIAEWSPMEDSNIFCRAFICPSATRKALKFVQPLISLDACHTKNRKYPTQLFLATCLDGNAQNFILCYAIAPVENTENWIWFLELVDRALYGIESTNMPIISDRQKGLVAAVREVWPGKIHAACANHLRANVKTRHGRTAANIFTGCIYANDIIQYESCLRRISSAVDSSKSNDAVDYIRTFDVRQYSRMAFPLPRMGKVTSNPCEQANSGLLPFREFAPFKLLVQLWIYMQQKLKDRRTTSLARQEALTIPALIRYNNNLKTFGQWQVFDDGQSTAKVQTTSGSEEYLVSLAPKKACSCFELQEMLWPCEHIMAWDDQEGRNPSAHFHRCWRTGSLRSLYDDVMPSFLVTDLQLSPNCAPPEVAVKRGRHRMVRFQQGDRGTRHAPRAIREGEDVVYNTSGQLFLRYPVFDDPNRVEPFPGANTSAGLPVIQIQPRKKKLRQYTGKCKCSNCGEAGHNRRTCPKIAEVDNVGSHTDHTQWSPLPREDLVATEYSIPSTAPSTGIGPDSTIATRHDDPFHSYNGPPENMQRYLDLAVEVAMECQGFGSQYQEDITSFD